MRVECRIFDELRSRKKFIDRKLAVLPKNFPAVGGDQAGCQISDGVDLIRPKRSAEHVIPTLLILLVCPPLQDIAQQVVHSAPTLLAKGSDRPDAATGTTGPTRR